MSGKKSSSTRIKDVIAIEGNIQARISRSYDYLDLQNNYFGIEQHLLKVQNDYFILEELHQQLKEETDKQQANLVEKLQKSYDIYSEKCLEIDVLQEKLEELENATKQNKSETLCAENRKAFTDVSDEQGHSREKLCKKSVKKALGNIGLSLEKTDKVVQVNLVDSEKLEGLFGGEHFIVSESVFNRISDLEESNRIIEKAMLSLKQHSETQSKEMSKLRKDLLKKSEECSNLHKEIKGMKKKSKSNKKDLSAQVNVIRQDLSAKNIVTTGSLGENTLVIEHKVLQTIVAGLNEMCDFTVELKKTILDQNSWIDMLVSAMNENRAPASEKGTADSFGTNPGESQFYSKRKHIDPLNCRTDIVFDGGNGLKNRPLAGPTQPTQDLTQSYCGAYSIGSKIDDYGGSKLKDVCDCGLDYKRRMESFSEKSHCDALGLDSEKSGVRDRDPAQAQHEVYQRSSVESIAQRLPGYPTQLSNQHENQPSSFIHDLCPMCGVIFDASYDVDHRRSHINGHFNN